MEKKKTKAIESALLYLDKAIQKLLRGEDAKSDLIQFCLQLAKQCEDEGIKDYANNFRVRAAVLKKI